MNNYEPWEDAAELWRNLARDGNKGAPVAAIKAVIEHNTHRVTVPLDLADWLRNNFDSWLYSDKAGGSLEKALGINKEAYLEYRKLDRRFIIETVDILVVQFECLTSFAIDCSLEHHWYYYDKDDDTSDPFLEGLACEPRTIRRLYNNYEQQEKRDGNLQDMGEALDILYCIEFAGDPRLIDKLTKKIDDHRRHKLNDISKCDLTKAIYQPREDDFLLSSDMPRYLSECCNEVLIRKPNPFSTEFAMKKMKANLDTET